MVSTSKASILVVDDEPNNFDVIELLLSDQFFTLHYASNGAEAIDSLPLFNPDVILLDVMMPGLDGIQVCQQIKAMPRWQVVPIIMVTALTAKEDLARCIQSGADDFVSKPVNRIELRARIHSMLRIKRQYDQIQSLSQLQEKTIFLLENNLQELRSNLISKLGHELKTPLNGILGALGFLTNEIGDVNQNPDILYESLDILNESSHRLEKLTQKLLNYCQLELATLTSTNKPEKATDSSPLPAPVCHSSILFERATTIAQTVERDVDLICQIEEISLQVSHKHLQLIIDELVENAFKFSQLKTPVTIKGICKEETFHLWISNLGRGMTEEQIASIGALMQFERKRYEQQGAGLGLEIAKKAVELYGGQFMISSIYQQETTIYFTLPIALPIASS